MNHKSYDTASSLQPQLFVIRKKKRIDGSDIDLVLNGQAMEWAIIPFLVFDIRDSGSPRSSTVVCGDSA